jgi:hypothetical protein
MTQEQINQFAMDLAMKTKEYFAKESAPLRQEISALRIEVAELRGTLAELRSRKTLADTWEGR